MRHRSSAWLLAAAMVGLTVYASLHPFSGWRLPAVPLSRLLLPPWSTYWTLFDLMANLVAYVPLGALLCVAQLREGASPSRAFAVAVAAGALLSWTMELLQNLLPARVPSIADLGLNTAGTLVGAALAVTARALGWVQRWEALRERWFHARGSGAALALLLLWPVGLLFPPSLPLGLGQVLPRINAALSSWLLDTPLEGWIEAPAEQLWVPLSPGGEVAAIALGLLAPVWVAYSVAHPGWRRLGLLLGAALLGFGATTLSTALNFGPEHALTWVTTPVMPGLVLALLLAAPLAWLPRRGAAGLGLMAITALLAMVNQAPADPYFAESLQAWEQGRFIRFHGLAQWVGWLWPYGALAYLLGRVAARRES
ncbi:VanZ family protein [Methylibium rhizosphaerae]|uniref:VanZ family protein n=1 Tax=Methylibium rhizosphaerae TaxID=2570323 RepID=UPI00112DDE0A|nr:VanZ family protein [Methylibium rhizosphaerae]